MSFQINKTISLFMLLSMLLTACGSETKPKTETKPEAPHEEVASTIASLTEEQIKTVGITYGIIEMKELTATIKANGNLKVSNNNKGNVTSLYGGVIQSLKIQVGSRISKGQIIAIVTNTEMLRMQEEYLTLKSQGDNAHNISTSGNTQYAALQVEKQSIQPQIEYARKELARQKELYEGNAGARKNLELAQSNLISLQKKSEVINSQLGIYSRTSNATNSAKLNSIKQQLQVMGINPNTIRSNNLQTSFYIKSPISGTVSEIFAKIGSYVDASSPVAEIVDNNSLHLDLNVFEKDLPLLKIGQIIHFTLTNNPTTEYDAVIYSIGTAFENNSKTIPVHCNVKGNKTGLIDGMNTTGIVSLSDVTTQAVPTEAIVEADGKYYIFVVTDKEAEQHDEGEETDEHGHETTKVDEHEHEEGEKHDEEKEAMTNFEKVEVIKGVSNMGYTAITLITELPAGTKIVSKGAFFINAKLSNTSGHDH